ncbi:hypothetical protein [Tersicoccus sp. Bi-70]|uniref:hypothetical protein n=1 Tax=Tersicoccus sp. Bi-70 TaxID=1897634 RepID=UPI0009778DB7|nr:hypothetical protein [Tersicoccus sp. Bi-70]OMH32978.1 hypothetical protein BGP79_05260 [Tersicoccus sp. Bi-70]
MMRAHQLTIEHTPGTGTTITGDDITDQDVVDVLTAGGWSHAGPTAWSAGTSAPGGAPVFLIETTAARIRATGHTVTVHIEDDDQAGIIRHPARAQATV